MSEKVCLLDADTVKCASVVGFEGSRSRKAIAFINRSIVGKGYSVLLMELSKTDRRFSEIGRSFSRNIAYIGKGDRKWKK